MIAFLEDLCCKVLEVVLVNLLHVIVLKVSDFVFQDLEFHKVVDVLDVDIVGLYIDSFALLLLPFVELFLDVRHDGLRRLELGKYG